MDTPTDLPAPPDPANTAVPSLHTIHLALDWTPNTTHIGFFVAQAMGAYREAGLAVHFQTPEDDGYTLTPAVKVARGLAQFGLAPSETLLSFSLQPDKPALRAVAAVLQQDTSAIAVPASSPVLRPAQLDGRRYASYSARFEMAIVRALLRADGGRGDLLEVQPQRLSAPAMLDSGEADATWIFSHWEGVLAARRGRPLRQFRLADHGLPYGYSPALLAQADWLQRHPAVARAFVQASARGWQLAAQQPERAASLLQATAGHPSLADGDFLADSARALAPAILDGQGRWGTMDPARWVGFADLLVRLGEFPADRVQPESWFSSALLGQRV